MTSMVTGDEPGDLKKQNEFFILLSFANRVHQLDSTVDLKPRSETTTSALALFKVSIETETISHNSEYLLVVEHDHDDDDDQQQTSSNLRRVGL